jgi:hypothetical protein
VGRVRDASPEARRVEVRVVRWADHRQGHGSTPKWCSPSCRQRAWEQSRAAASGLAAVRVVERRVEVAKSATAGRNDWPRLLGDLSRQLDDGRIYDRDLLALSAALTTVLDAFGRRCGRDRGQLAQMPLHHRKG